MTTRPEAWRVVGPEAALELTELERDANLVGLAHVFGDEPYPFDDVLARWAIVLDDASVRVEVVSRPDSPALLALTAYDDTLRHLAVHPSAWGTGLARAGVERAMAAGASRLWVLELNTRARGLYERLGWGPTGVTQECPWPPFPVELEYAVLPRA